MPRIKSAMDDVMRRMQQIQAILPIMISVCVVGTGNALLTTTFSLHLSDPAIASGMVQLLLTAFPIGFLDGCLCARSLVARFTHERVFLGAALFAAIAACGYMTTASFPAWFVFRLMNGFAMSTLFVVCESWVNLYASQHNRGALFSLYMLMTSLAVLFGQLLLEAAGPHSPYLFAMALAVILAGLLYARFVGGPWPALPVSPAIETATLAKKREHRMSLWQLTRLAPVTIICVFQAGMTNMNVFTMTPIYGERVGLTAAAAVSLVTAFSIGGMLAQAPAGWLSDRVDRRLLLLLQGAMTTILCGSIAWLGRGSEALLYLLFFAYGAVALTIYPIGIAYANSRLDSRQMVSASGGLLLLYSVGNIMTPGLAAGLMDMFAPQALFLLLGGGALAVAVTAAFSPQRRSLPSAEPCLTPGGNQ